jgi:hypothetical protein
MSDFHIWPAADSSRLLLVAAIVEGLSKIAPRSDVRAMIASTGTERPPVGLLAAWNRDHLLWEFVPDC